MQETALRVAVGLELPASPRLTWGPELGGGMDYVVFTPRELPGTQVEARKPDHDFRPVCHVALRGAFLGDGWLIAVPVSLTLLLVDVRYDVVLRDEQHTQIDPWILQPGIAIEVGWR